MITVTYRFGTIVLTTSSGSRRYNRNLLTAAMIHTYDYPDNLNAVADALMAGGYSIDGSTAYDYALVARRCIEHNIEP